MPRDNNRFFDWQDRASALAREAPRPRGHAPGDGADPNRHAGGGPDCTGPVETAALQVLPSQCLINVISLQVLPSQSLKISSVTQCLISVIFQKLLFDVNNISLQRATLLGMWLIPVGFCLKFGWHRFIYVWSIFSVITAFITFKATRKPISGSTPRYA